jgi:hypothetical protein
VQETAFLVSGYSFSDAHINRIIFEALASNPTLQLFVADPFGVLDHNETSEGPKAAPAADARSGLPETLAFRDNAIARLAQIQDARIAVLTGEAATFENLATELLPNPDALVLSEDDPDHEALRRALVDVVKRPDE